MPSQSSTASNGSGGKQDVAVHMFWIGEAMPQWVAGCVQSYLNTGHRVNWWLYMQEREADLEGFKKVGDLAALLDHRGLKICNANTIMPYEKTRRFYYHGMGEDGKWSGWAPFSDWFRYEVLAQFGGWWVDADGVSVRPLQGLHVNTSDVAIFCTERHRLDRRSVGAVAVVPPRPAKPVDGVKLVGPGPSGGQAAFFQWAEQVTNAGLEICLVTNNHIYIPRHQLKMMRMLADEMRPLLERYAEEVRQRGVASVRTLTAAGRSNSALPTGTIGMLLFQRAVREELAKVSHTGLLKPCVLHWSLFNPIEATDPTRMHRVLGGLEELRGDWIRSIHTFRQVRDEWKRSGLSMPTPLLPKVSDVDPPPMEPKRPRGPQPPAAPPLVIVEVAASGPLLKRRRPVQGIASVGEGAEMRNPLRTEIGNPLSHRLALAADFASSAFVDEDVDAKEAMLPQRRANQAKRGKKQRS